MKNKTLLIFIILGIAACSCTIKEDRGPCPCLLKIHVDGCERYSDKLTIAGWADERDRLFLDRIKLSEHTGIYTRKVAKGELEICAVAGDENMFLKDNILTIPEGFQCGMIWASQSGKIDASGDTADTYVNLHKQFATIFIQLDSLTMKMGDVLLRAVGNVNGVDIASLEPQNGRFRCFTDRADGDIQSVTVPRQSDDSLELEVYVDGILKQSIRIGELISNSGYSWAKEDLDDIYLSISLFASTIVSVNINGWETERITYLI